MAATSITEDQAGYWALVRAFPLRPVRSDAELCRAVAVVDALVARRDLDDGERDYLLVLARLVEAYEDESHPMRPATDAEMLRFLIESNGLTQAGLARATGLAESAISEVLAGKKSLRRPHIAALADYFHVSPAVFEFRPARRPPTRKAKGNRPDAESLRPKATRRTGKRTTAGSSSRVVGRGSAHLRFLREAPVRGRSAGVTKDVTPATRPR